jgi:DNA-binding CsgD family transcriptional regulator
MLLVVAAAEPLGDPVLLGDALERLGIPAAAAAAAEAAGLIEVGSEVRFRHPLVRSAAYYAASPQDRRTAHQAIADVTDRVAAPDRRAWHEAQAAASPDERIAADLERSADRAQARGGLAAAAAFTQRAAELTPHSARRARRALAAAQLAQAAGSLESSLRLLASAESGELDAAQRGSAKLQRAQIAFQRSRDDDAATMLLEAAKALKGDRAREAYLEAFAAAMYVGRSSPGRLLQVAQAVRSHPLASDSPRALDLLLDGLSANVALGYEEAVPTLQRAVAALRAENIVVPDDLRWLGLACTVAMDLRDDAAHAVLAESMVQLSRSTGALAVLPTALNYRAGVHLLAGEFTEAGALVGEAYAVSVATGSADLIYADLALSAWRGDERGFAEIVDRRSRAANGEGRTQMAIEYATAVLGNGLADYQRALDAARDAEKHDELGFNAFVSPELVESAARLGRPDLATLAIERLGDRARVCKTDWAVGMEFRSRALVSDGPDADELYRQAIASLGRTNLAVYLARTRLVYGEWLRRNRRRTDAREHLREAYETLSEIGAGAFARRAARELQATGEHPRQHASDALDTLTVQELSIARHAASGATSKEIAAALFLSPRTIDAHLRNIFRKTGVTSRRQLRNLPLLERRIDPT